MPPRGRVGPRPLAACAALLLLAGCYEPAVHESVLVTISADGGIRLSVETVLRSREGLTDHELEEIQRVVDLYALGRDAWLRGFKRASAREIAHRIEGPQGAPTKILREGTVPSLNSLVEVMPDAIANFELIEDRESGILTVRIVHIDAPRTLRESRRQAGKEIASLSEAAFELSERQCDLYDYLAGRPDRREAVVRALLQPARIAGVLSPKETAVLRGTMAGLEGILAFSVGIEPPDEPPAIARMSFSAFEHDFCIRLPVEAVESVGLVKGSGPADSLTYCAERLVTDDLMAEIRPDADPPELDDGLLGDPEKLAAAPFTCTRHAGARELEALLWERILPRPSYELSWRAPGDPAVFRPGASE